MTVLDLMQYLKDQGLSYEDAIKIHIVLQEADNKLSTANKLEGIDFLFNNEKVKGVIVKIDK